MQFLFYYSTKRLLGQETLDFVFATLGGGLPARRADTPRDGKRPLRGQRSLSCGDAGAYKATTHQRCANKVGKTGSLAPTKKPPAVWQGVSFLVEHA
jgi:hypothetical protein